MLNVIGQDLFNDTKWKIKIKSFKLKHLMDKNIRKSDKAMMSILMQNMHVNQCVFIFVGNMSQLFGLL